MASASKSALSAVAPFVLRRAKWSFVGYGLAVYAGLRVAKHFGIFGDYPARAIDLIDTQVKSKLGFSNKAQSAAQT